jgi:hypothetical protein
MIEPDDATEALTEDLSLRNFVRRHVRSVVEAYQGSIDLAAEELAIPPDEVRRHLVDDNEEDTYTE